ncbi:MAG: ComEA family DNA-binding protein [Oscillospiraceae bacterium]
MIKPYFIASAAVILVLAVVSVISIYDSEEFTEPIIGYSEAETLIPLDSIWEESEELTMVQTSLTTSPQKQTEETLLTAVTEINTSQSTVSESSETETIPEQGGLININTATVEELKTLNGIGEVIAARIVEYANTIGFNSIEDIKNVKGIGDKKYENIKDKITV